MDEVRVRMLVVGAFGGEPCVESTEQLVARVVEELMEWRGGCAGGLGILTASPHRTLIEYGKAHRELQEKLEQTQKTLVVLDCVAACSHPFAGCRCAHNVFESRKVVAEAIRDLGI